MIDDPSAKEALAALINPIADVLEAALDRLARTKATVEGYADTAEALAAAAVDLAALAATMGLLAGRADTEK